MIEIITTCPICGKETVLEVPFEGYAAWEEGMNIQDVMPQLKPEERELLISGICPDCWKNLFGED